MITIKTISILLFFVCIFLILRLEKNKTESLEKIQEQNIFISSLEKSLLRCNNILLTDTSHKWCIKMQ